MPKTWDQHRCGSGPKAPLGQGVVSGELPVQGATFGCSVASSLLSCPLQVQSHVMVSTVTLYIRRRPPRLPSVSEATRLRATVTWACSPSGEHPRMPISVRNGLGGNGPPQLLLEAPSASPAESWESHRSEAGGTGGRGWQEWLVLTLTIRILF